LQRRGQHEVVPPGSHTCFPGVQSAKIVLIVAKGKQLGSKPHTPSGHDNEGKIAEQEARTIRADILNLPFF